ncbi:MAG: hypothetical protein GTO45_20435 [Candidatus Aminicenantes bacterium]|nr:hypothetical protein [Candidatus Aminicenantes bacterium]NIN21629.1 hypothetical protein [Candidatus Aminicenantes bacterium]NIN44310.1 hypothetical protein [Candidatus Aminicenantes bacterium]NIN87129.1 hypothetical protein [Candidatus Aminicenantes bacterium]NIR09087.1 hypothetical protein [Candidatus Aminicenantes bacterium]
MPGSKCMSGIPAGVNPAGAHSDHKRIRYMTACSPPTDSLSGHTSLDVIEICFPDS